MSNEYKNVLFLMDEAYRLALDGNLKDALFITNKLSEVPLIGVEHAYILSALKESIVRTINKSMARKRGSEPSIGSEYSLVHTWVRDNKDNFGDIEVIDKFSSLESGRRPDFLFMKNDIKYPVECKKYFRDKGINQLREYMKEMGVKIGYAIACEFKVDQPDDIIFIKCE